MTAQDKSITAKHGSIAAALAAAQAQMGKALKSANNPHFKSKYADLSSVVDACLPALNANGIAVVQPTTDDENGHRYVETVLIHGDSGQDLRCRVPLIVAKNDMQGYGSAVTYARRYGLMSMAGIAPEDDDGNAAAAAAPKQERRADPLVKNGYAEARDYLLAAETLEDLQAAWGRLPADVRANATVIKAKDDRKAQLTHARQPSIGEIIGDEVPY